MISKDFLTGDDRGVSPVIGVILMVAVTVVLAAVIGASVLDLGDNVGESPSAGLDYDESSNLLTVVSVSNADSITVDYNYDYSADDGTDTDSDSKSDSFTLTGDLAGQSADLETRATSDAANDTTFEADDITIDGFTGEIVVTATVDGDTQVIQTFDA